MSHLSPERLAAIADEEPTAVELAHLHACLVCTEEREAHRSLLRLAASERTSIGLPLTRWESLAPALHADGLAPAEGPAAVRHSRNGQRWLQAAAALLFAAGGAAFGRYSAGAAPLPGVHAVASSASNRTTDTAAVAFRSVDDARTARTQAELMYQNAAAYIAQHDTSSRATESPSAMRTRLAALDQVSSAMRQALNQAPYDPVINDYYLTTLGQREATLRQLNTALPAGLRVNSF